MYICVFFLPEADNHINVTRAVFSSLSRDVFFSFVLQALKVTITLKHNICLSVFLVFSNLSLGKMLMFHPPTLSVSLGNAVLTGRIPTHRNILSFLPTYPWLQSWWHFDYCTFPSPPVCPSLLEDYMCIFVLMLMPYCKRFAILQLLSQQSTFYSLSTLASSIIWFSCPSCCGS